MHLPPPLGRRKMLGLAARHAAVLSAHLAARFAAFLVAVVFGLGLAITPPAAQAQGVELVSLRASSADGALTLDFNARVDLPRVVEEALSRGVPVYFYAEASVRRSRWYWRDERVTRVSRSWRVAFQPLTGSWRVGLGGLNQNYASLAEALAAASRSAGWKLADLSQLGSSKNYYVEFTYRLDTKQLPSPMQFGLFTQGDWAVGVERTVPVQ